VKREVTVAQQRGSATLSQDFTLNIEMLYEGALQQLVAPNSIREGINCHTMHAAPALISAVAAVEAFINEVTFGSPVRLYFKDSPLWSLDQDWLQEIDVRAKLVIIPQLLFGKTFNRGEQPFQNFTTLVKARNDVIHYKMEAKEPKYLADLQQKGIALTSVRWKVEQVWVHSLCCSEVIRWANNVVTAVAKGLVALIPEQYHIIAFASMADNFREIPRSLPEDRLRAAGLRLK
jgi:hypothetical protein